MGMSVLKGIALEDARAKLDGAARIVRQVIDTGGDEPGTDLARVAMAKAVGHLLSQPPHVVAINRWGSASRAAMELQHVKAPQGAGGTPSWGDLPGSAGGEFLAAVAPMTALGRLPAVRQVPAGVPGIAIDGDATSYWIGEGKGIPLSRSIFNREALHPMTIAAMTAASKEILSSTDPSAEAMVRNSLMRAVALASDVAFLDAANGGNASTPASITNGAHAIPSAGDVSDDLAAVLEAFEGDLSRSAWVGHPALFARLALRSGGGIGRDLGALGGTLLGMPAIASAGSAVDQLVLVDGGAIIQTGGDIQVSVSPNATVEMEDTAPTGDSLTPAAMSATVVSMFATHSVALKAVRAVAWKNVRTNKSVVVLTGVLWP